VQDLLPLYVAGTLSPDQRRVVEDALSADSALEEERRTWASIARLATEAHAIEAAGHPSASVIVDFAGRNRRLAPLFAPRVHYHAVRCAECRALIEEIARTFGEPVRVKPARARFRPAFGWGTLAVALLVLVLGTMVVQRILQPPAEVAELRLAYDPGMRGGAEAEVPILRVSEATRRVRLGLEIPHSALSGTRYLVVVTGPSSEHTELPSAPEVTAVNPERDLLTAEFDRAALPADVGDYEVEVIEVLPPGTDLSPETYRYRFRLESP
jgi:hypothetical protein